MDNEIVYNKGVCIKFEENNWGKGYKDIKA
jgi:hypothetical protein